MNNPFDYTPDAACDEAFALLVAELEKKRTSDNPDDINFYRELEGGKMIGVLVAADDSGRHHTLYAFSGQLGSGGFNHRGFVEPVFDYLHPEGYFKKKEREISEQNAVIRQFEEGEYAAALTLYDSVKARLDAVIAEFRERCRISRLERHIRRGESQVSATDDAEMIRQSQYEKAELRRKKAEAAALLEPYELKVREAKRQLEKMKMKRRHDSETLQNWLFNNFRLLNGRGESRSLSEIFAETAVKIPPTGAGECCAPKLLQAAYRRGWKPLSMAEYWFGKPKEGEIRIHGNHYPACRGRCLPVLTWMLRGIEVTPPPENAPTQFATEPPEILYQNNWFCVVNKPAGWLSVPGKESNTSIQQWLTEFYGEESEVKVAHRLDRDTSGLLIATFGSEAYRVMQRLFATREVSKTYVAELEGNYLEKGIPGEGRIDLPLSPDLLDRPRQRVDFENGKEAVTIYRFTGTADGRSRIIFHPLTGRTHQLRVHAASDSGLGMHISGDRLYGKKPCNGGRMHLHAQRVAFRFPIDGHDYCFESPCPF